MQTLKLMLELPIYRFHINPEYLVNSHNKTANLEKNTAI